MYQVLRCWLLVLSVSPFYLTTLAADIDIYPEFADEAIIRRIQHVLSEWRQKQLRLEPEPLPQFTFRFPEERDQQIQSDLFAVPPSDPRYYQQPLPPLRLPADPKQYRQPSPVPGRLPLNSRYYQQPAPPPENVGVLEENKRLDDEGENEQSLTPTTVQDETLTDNTTPQVLVTKAEDDDYIFKRFISNDSQDIILVAVIAGCGAAAAAGVVALSVGWYKLHNNSKAAADIEYPAYGVTGPNKEITPTGDRRLAQSAQMYHYQHQKQQIIAMESNRANNERRGSVSEGDSDEENEEGDYTVYECPGLAATGELEVKNPLFLDDPTPAANHKTVEESAVPIPNPSSTPAPTTAPVDKK